MSEEIAAAPAYIERLGCISKAYVAGSVRATQAVNTHIGSDIVKFDRAEKPGRSTGRTAAKSQPRSAPAAREGV